MFMVIAPLFPFRCNELKFSDGQNCFEIIPDGLLIKHATHCSAEPAIASDNFIHSVIFKTSKSTQIG